VPVKVDTRVISATNKVLPQEVESSRFREDLYYRLNVISIYLPALRDRLDDIPLLVEHFLSKHRPATASGPARISQGANADPDGVRMAGQRSASSKTRSSGRRCFPRAE
jgi:DNA-binding NtrC family response regulator